MRSSHCGVATGRVGCPVSTDPRARPAPVLTGHPTQTTGQKVEG